MGSASVDDLAGLERIFKRAIILRDIVGESIYDSGKYQRGGNGVRGKVEPQRPRLSQRAPIPLSREVHIFEGDVWQAIREATREGPITVWLLGGQDRQLSIDQFVLQDGRTVWTREIHEQLQAICAAQGRPELAERIFDENHIASIVAKERNGWKPTPAGLLPDVEKACVEHGHGGLFDSMDYDTRDVFSIDMKACYPASFQGMGQASPYFERFGHPTHRMVRVAINGLLPGNIGTGFAEVQEWEFEAACHPVVPAWFGRHFRRKGCGLAPTQLLAYLTESGLLKALEVIVYVKTQKDVWLPESTDQACAIIGKFTQGRKAGGKRLTRRLVTDQGEFDFDLVGAPVKCDQGHVLTY